jgi:outer membrane protein insertion porin family
VRLDVNGDVLVVIVEERPTVADVDFVGTKEFDKDALQKALRDIGLTDGRPYDQALADRAEQELKRQYINRSLYGAQVVTTVTPIERNRVNLTFTVTEGDSARIREVRIVGNKAFSESTLRSLFDLDTGGWLTWYTKSTATRAPSSTPTWRRCARTTSAAATSSSASTRPRSRSRRTSRTSSITINITEGDRFVVAGVKLDGNYLGKDDEFKSLVTIKPGEPYNADQVTETTKAFTDYFGTFGYAFAQRRGPPGDRPRQQPRDLTLAAEPSRRAYVRRVAVARQQPHPRRSDPARVPPVRVELVRRRQDQAVARPRGPPRLLHRSERRDPRRARRARPGRPDRDVAEKPTGSLQLGAGFSSAEKVALTFGIKQENAFGTGNFLGVEVNTSKYNRTHRADHHGSVLHAGRHFAHGRASTTRTTRPYDYAGRRRLQAGQPRALAIRFGVPFSEVDTVFFGVGLERYAFDAQSSFAGLTPKSYRGYFQCKTDATGLIVSRCDQDSVWGVPLTIGWGRDNRDSALVPTSGRLQRANVELGAGGDMNATSRRATSTSSSSRSASSTPSPSTASSATARRFGGKPFPVFKNFYAGGLGSVRGFEQSTLGPRDCTASRPDRRRRTGRHQEGDLQCRTQHAVPRRRQRPHACASTASSTSATCSARVRKA